MFDSYIHHALKGNTREKRRTYTPVQYEIQDDTSLKNLTLKRFILHIQTKQDFTIYLEKHKSLKKIYYFDKKVKSFKLHFITTPALYPGKYLKRWHKTATIK